jgi:hypothetical protein
MWPSIFSMPSLPKSDAAKVLRLPAPVHFHLGVDAGWIGLAVLSVYALSLLASSAFGAEKIAAQLSAPDAVSTPGRPVKLEARLARGGVLGDIEIGGEQLEFLVNGKPIGTAMTGGDGRAYLEYTPRMRGNHPLIVRLVPSKRVEATNATATVATWEKRRPLLLVERSAVVEDRGRSGPLPDLGIGLLRQSDPKPAAGAPEELKRLSEFFFNIIYVEREGDNTPERFELRDWLHQNSFPFGLRVKVKDGRAPLAEKIQELQKDGWENLKAGVGRTREFAEVLIEHRLRVVLIPGARDQDVPRKAQVAKDWKEARKFLQR